jgi:HPt (histidine-containing phosphotransfer) domain-containing protein
VIEEAQRKKKEMGKMPGIDNNYQQLNSQLAEIFARDAEKTVTTLESILENNFNTESDIQLYIINIHAMKSALANIGQRELSDSANKLEQAGRDKDTNVLLSETNNFLSELRKVINEVKPKDEDTQTREDSKDSLVFLRDKLTVIKEACTVFDKKTAKNALNELREKTW